ncbi:hypothetical protein [Mesorhizobium sp.]|uniref:hypothetical protein n=1 Tax=Mesorhizobium sp. TaxID=1871066 RepID=UPI000FE9EB0A|nr:hypothetical protein [Mesorhizobium sp.]RWP51362.1 MAG: hypothetical protein EOR06_22445 [Mesorhizobium sp.]
MGGVKVAFLEAIAAVIPVTLVYFSGWAYLSTYVGEFGIDATQLEVSFPTVLVYAFHPLQSWPVFLFVVVVALVAIVTFKVGVRSQAFWWTSIGISFVLALIVISYAAKNSAFEMAENVWRGQKIQSFANVNSSGQDIAGYRSCQTELRLRQIIGLPNRLFLLCRSAKTPCDRGVMFAIGEDGRIVYTANEIRRDIRVRQICDS